MCGIVGMVSSYSNGFSHKEASMFELMLFVDTFRGWDSTGVFGVDLHGNVELHKEASHGADFICTKEFQEFLKESTKAGKIMVGHNRAATRGTVSDDNAHPFCVDDKIVLVQNGTMRGDHKKHANVDVDTHAIAHILAKESDVTKALQSFDAAYAFVWYNVSDETLYIIRNSERPLWIAEFDKTGFMFASEKETLIYAAAKADGAVKFKDVPYQLPPATLMTFNLKTSEVRKEALTFRPKVVQMDHSTGHRRMSHAAWASAFYDADSCDPVIERTAAGVHTLALPPVVTHTAKHSPNDIQLGFTDIAMRDSSLVDWCYYSEKDAQDGINELNLNAAQNKDFVLAEVIDYKPANNNPHCTRWFVVAVMKRADQEVYETSKAVLLHYMVVDKTEDQVLDLVGDLVEVKITSSTTYLFRDKESRPRWLARSFASQVNTITVN
jgi:hypothetical protein